MKKEFIDKVIKNGVVDTKKYRYIYSVSAEKAEIRRIAIDLLDTTATTHGWELVKVIDDGSNQFGICACIRSVESSRDLIAKGDVEKVFDYLSGVETKNGPFFNKTMWEAFDIVFPGYRDSLETTETQTTETEQQEEKAVCFHCGGIRHAIKAETRQEAQDRENWETCKRIAEEVEAYAEGRIYKCPECGAVHDLTGFDGDTYKCPECETVHDPFYLERLGLWDYMDDVLDIEYRVSGRMELRSVQVMVACGGPNIYIDTGARAVQLFWWTDRAEYPLDYDACNAIDEWAEQLFECR